MEYNFLKLIHLFAVVLFLGNIITGVFWMRLAMKTRDLKIVSHTINGIIRSDKVFTVPGVVTILIGGFAAAIEGGYPLLRTGWIFWSIVLFTISGLAYFWKIAPLQKNISKLTASFENADDFNWVHLFKVYYQWEVWAFVATSTPLCAFVMMVLKIPQ